MHAHLVPDGQEAACPGQAARLLVFSLIQPVIWLFLFGQLFRQVVELPGFGYHGSYLDYLVPGVDRMNAMSNNMWAGMTHARGDRPRHDEPVPGPPLPAGRPS